MTFESGPEAILLLVGRICYGGFLIFAGILQLQFRELMAETAKAKRVPLPEIGVIATGLFLIGGGAGIVIGIYPGIAAGMLIAFFVIVTPLMHNFWAVPEWQAQEELTNFHKNIELLGAALVFLALSTQRWGYAVNIGIWV